jgi:hypothetical protein
MPFMELDAPTDGLSALPMLRALHASGPFPDYAEKLDPFGQLVGAWDIEDVHFHPDGTPRVVHVGEWLFGWVLEGRAVQDVIISPPRREGAGESRYEYGTTIRLYDPSADVWHVTFVAPVNGAVFQLEARAESDGIVLTGTSPDGTLNRWVFSDMSEDAFIWRGYESADEGRSWFLEEEIRARRRRS